MNLPESFETQAEKDDAIQDATRNIRVWRKRRRQLEDIPVKPPFVLADTIAGRKAQLIELTDDGETLDMQATSLIRDYGFPAAEVTAYRFELRPELIGKGEYRADGRWHAAEVTLEVLAASQGMGPGEYIQILNDSAPEYEDVGIPWPEPMRESKSAVVRNMISRYYDKRAKAAGITVEGLLQIYNEDGSLRETE